STVASPLRGDAQRLDAILRSAMDAIITINGGHRIVLFNAAAENIFRCSAADAIGTTLDRFIPESLRARHREQVEHFARTGQSARHLGHQGTLRALRADGSEFPMEASISQVTVGDQKLLTVIVRDVSARVNAESGMRLAREELLEGQV